VFLEENFLVSYVIDRMLEKKKNRNCRVGRTRIGKEFPTSTPLTEEPALAGSRTSYGILPPETVPLQYGNDGQSHSQKVQRKI
jgi:hypothetical protein